MRYAPIDREGAVGKRGVAGLVEATFAVYREPFGVELIVDVIGARLARVDR
jgi:hypothetical protein